jgi:hypothetical protein
MEEAFFTFRKFNDPVPAADMAEQLRLHQIPLELEDGGRPFDPSFAHNNIQWEIRLKLRAGDFEKADEILRSFYKDQAGRVPSDHYVYQFTNLELINIIRNPDEWGYLDQALAESILTQQGIAIPARELKRFHTEKIGMLSRPQPADRSWIYLGYVLAVLAAPLGLFVGLSMAFLKKTLPDGRQRFAYHETDRKTGKRILMLAAIWLPGWIIGWIWLSKR